MIYRTVSTCYPEPPTINTVVAHIPPYSRRHGHHRAGDNVLGTMIEQPTSMVATLQTINDEQQDLIYKIEVMADIRWASNR
jgi:hypothetical protein